MICFVWGFFLDLPGNIHHLKLTLQVLTELGKFDI